MISHIGSHKFSLLRREYLPSAVSMLKNSPKISDITKRDILRNKLPSIDKKDDKSAVMKISAVSGIP